MFWFCFAIRVMSCATFSTNHRYKEVYVKRLDGAAPMEVSLVKFSTIFQLSKFLQILDRSHNLGQNKWNIWTSPPPPISMMPKWRVFAPSRLHHCFLEERGLIVLFILSKIVAKKTCPHSRRVNNVCEKESSISDIHQTNV